MTCDACGGKGVLSINDLGELGMLPAMNFSNLLMAPTDFPSWYCIRYCWIPRGLSAVLEDAGYQNLGRCNMMNCERHRMAIEGEELWGTPA